MERHITWFSQLTPIQVNPKRSASSSVEEQPIWSTLLLAHIVSRDPMSTTYRNFCHIKEVFGLDPWDFSSQRIKMKLPVKNIPEDQKWRIGLLSNLKKMKEERNAVDSTRICAMLDSLCST